MYNNIIILRQALHYDKIKKSSLSAGNSCESNSAEFYDNTEWLRRSVAWYRGREGKTRLGIREEYFDRAGC